MGPEHEKTTDELIEKHPKLHGDLATDDRPISCYVLTSSAKILGLP